MATQTSRASRLRDYYGISGESASSEAVDAQPAPSESKAPAADAESAKVEAVPIEELTRKHPLPELLNMAAQLMEGIRELNGDRQSLVYNNHQDLVAASETVGQMRSGLDKLAPTREALLSGLAEVDRLQAELQQTHAAASDEPDEGIDWHAVKPVVSLPATLRNLLRSDETREDAGVRKDALELWNQFRPVLEEWDRSGVLGAGDLLKESKHILQDAGIAADVN